MNNFFLSLVSFTLLMTGLHLQASCQSGRLVLPGAHDNQYYVERWTTDNGLPSNTLLYSFQSTRGYIWLSCFDGVVKFDGIEFNTYNKAKNNTISNAISKIVEDSHHNLWIGTYGDGIMLYKNGAFEPFKDEKLSRQTIQTIFIDNKDGVWVGTRGNGLFFSDGQSFEKFQNHPSLENTTVSAIIQAPDGAMWFGTEGNGLIKYANGQFHVYTLANGLPNDKIFSIYFDHRGGMWVGTSLGLSKFYEGSFKSVSQVNECLITTLFEDNANNLWVATDCGLFRKNVQSNEWTKLALDGIIPSDHYTDGFVDGNQNIWLTTYHAGLAQIKKSKFVNYTLEDGLATKAVSSVCYYGDNKYLVGANNGIVNLIDNGQVSELKFRTKIPDTRIRSILKDSRGNLWIGTSAGMLLKKTSGEEKWYTTDNGLPDNEVRLFYEDADHTIWFGTRSGGLVKVINDHEFKVFNKTNLLNSNFIMSIREDRNHNLLIGTNENGLNIMKPDGTVEYITEADGLASDLIFNTYTDEENVTWVVTNGGISRMEGKEFFNITAAHGLVTDAPFDFIEDEFGDVWLPTSKGIVKASKQELNKFAKGEIEKINFRLYDKQDGLEISETTGAAKSVVAKNGNIWVPALNGVIVIDPKKIGVNKKPPPTFITSLDIDNNFTPLNKDTVKLDPDFQRIVINYEALNYTSPTNVRYKYKLENFDDNWVDAGKEREVHYTNLKHGNYTFKVKACNEDGIWNQEASMLTIIVSPLFYETPTFYLLTTIGVTLIMLGAFRLSVYNVKRRNKLLSTLVEEQTSELREINTTLEEQKEELTTQHDLLAQKNSELERAQEKIISVNEELKKANSKLEDKVEERTKDLKATLEKLTSSNEELDTFIYRASHDLKGPTASLLGLAMLGKTVSKEESYIDFFNRIENTSHNMNRILGKLIAMHTILQTTVSYSPIHLENLIAEIKRSLEIPIKNYKVINLSNPSLTFYSDHTLLTIILRNLFENAVIFNKGIDSIEIKLNIKKEKNTLCITVEDNGEGIEENIKEKIFDLFYRGSQKSLGNGLGLYLIKKAVEKLSGSIEVQSNVGEFTRFTIRMPWKDFM